MTALRVDSDLRAPVLNGLDIKRILLGCCVLAGWLGWSSAALADSVSGSVSLVGATSFTIQTPGRPVGVINALSGAANRVTRSDFPYVYGGGHAQAGIASVGMRGPGYNGRRIGYDCSGSVAAVLSRAGLWPAGQGVPSDAGIVSELLHAGAIARGAGTGPVEVTLYDDPGVHIFMNIDGRFFGTSDGGGGGNPRGGAGWLDDGAPDAFSPRYKRYHVLPSLLRASTNAAHSVTFEPGSTLGVLALGAKVQVTYQQTRRGMLVATGLLYPASITTGGIVSALAADGSSLSLQEADGSTLTFDTSTVSQLLEGIVVGNTVQVTYVAGSAGPTPVAVTVTATPSPDTAAAPPGTTTAPPGTTTAPPGGDGSSSG